MSAERCRACPEPAIRYGLCAEHLAGFRTWARALPGYEPCANPGGPGGWGRSHDGCCDPLLAGQILRGHGRVRPDRLIEEWVATLKAADHA